MDSPETRNPSPRGPPTTESTNDSDKRFSHRETRVLTLSI
ncbi:hypothetical protein RSAG8_11506, partial [Rhizoctonia solani AG-8 WAC10335]